MISIFHQILADTGFTPQWVELQKEISLQIDELRKELGKSRCVILKVVIDEGILPQSDFLRFN